MKVAFVCLHYGSDYLGYAIKPIYDSVDKIVIAYASQPSHGHSTPLTNPDSRQACYDAAHMWGDPQNKIQWIDGNWKHEGLHRQIVWDLYPKANLISIVDADEIWHPEQFAAVQEWCMTKPVRNFKQKLVTPWRSFNWLCTDEMRPDRFYRPDMPMNTIEYVPQEIGIYYHMGYAREPKHIEYKMSCHGHKCELKGNWFRDKYMAWSPTNNIGDLHPTCKDTWNAKPFDKNLLPTVLRSHPYWDKPIIE